MTIQKRVEEIGKKLIEDLGLQDWMKTDQEIIYKALKDTRDEAYIRGYSKGMTQGYVDGKSTKKK